MWVEAGDRDARTRNSKARAKVVRHNPSRLRDQIGCELRNHVLERQVDCHRHNRKLRRPQHHHRPRGFARRFMRQLGEEFGVTRLRKARTIEHILGHGVGNDGRGTPRQYVCDRATDRSDRGRRARSVGLAGRGRDRHTKRHNRQSARKGFACLSWCHDAQNDVDAEYPSALS